MLTQQYQDTDAHLQELWTMITYAARYGSQPVDKILSMTASRLIEFNNGISFWVEKENQSGKER